jgi:hypothetical protein
MKDGTPDGKHNPGDGGFRKELRAYGELLFQSMWKSFDDASKKRLMGNISHEAMRYNPLKRLYRPL